MAFAVSGYRLLSTRRLACCYWSTTVNVGLLVGLASSCSAHMFNRPSSPELLQHGPAEYFTGYDQNAQRSLYQSLLVTTKVVTVKNSQW